MSAAALAVLAARCGMVMLFLPFSALDKLLGFGHAVRQAQEMFSPRPLAVAAIGAGLFVEIGCTLGVVTGSADRAAAFVIAGYCALTALLYKRFWAQGDYWTAPNGKGRSLFWDFLKNLSLGAGFLMLVLGTDGSGLRPFLDHPFASSHPYRIQP